MTTPQHGKNRKRPRGWHRGRSAGRTQAKALARVEVAEQRAVRQDAEVAQARVRGGEETALWRALEHTAPFVPSWPTL